MIQPKALTVARRPLDVFFAPESIAIFGASEAPSSVGRTLMSNLITNPSDAILFPITPKRFGVLGIKTYPQLQMVPGPVDLAIIATPAPAVPDIISECQAAGVKGAIVLSAGFGECGPDGFELEEQIKLRLRGGSLRVLGPNSLGVACPRTGLNASFAPAMVPVGNVGLLF
jgi:acetyltransferase